MQDSETTSTFIDKTRQGHKINESNSHFAPIEVFPFIDWEFSSVKSSIGSAAVLESLERRVKFPLPEMVFPDNILIFENKKAGLRICLQTEDALMACPSTTKDKVLDAANVFWKKKHSDIVELNNSVASTLSSLSKTTPPKKQCVDTLTSLRCIDYDWTYSTTFNGTVTFSDVKSNVVSNKIAPGISRIVKSNKSIDLDLLRMQDKILYFKEIIFYEDELDDNGISILSAKVVRPITNIYILLIYILYISNILCH